MSATQCSTCRAPLHEDAKYCTQCGSIATTAPERTIIPIPPGFEPPTREIVPVPPGFETGPARLAPIGAPADRGPNSNGGTAGGATDAPIGTATSRAPHGDADGQRIILPLPPEWAADEAESATANAHDRPAFDGTDANRLNGGAAKAPSSPGTIAKVLANPSALIIGIPLIIMGVLFVWKVVLNQSTAGASSPEAVVSRLVDGAQQQDVLGLANAVAPSESMNLADIASTTFDALDRANGTDAESTAVEVGLDSVDVSQVNDSIALIDVDFSARIESDDAWLRAAVGSDSNSVEFSSNDIVGALNERFASGANRAESLTLVAVKEDGGWFWSPMLTSVLYLDIYVDGIETDWDAIDRLPEATASSSGEAFDNAIEAISAYDVQALAASTDTATTRALMVIDGGLQTILDEPDVQQNQIDIDPTYESTSNGLELTHIDVSVSNTLDTTSASVSGWCVRLDGSDATNCLDLAWLDPIDPSPMISTADERGGVVVDVFGTIRHQADLVLANSSLNRILGIVDYPWLAGRLRTTPGSTATVDFGDEPFALLAVPVDQGQIPAISFDATNSTRYMFERADGRLSPTRQDDEAGTWLLAVYAEGAYCARTLCDWEPGGDATVQVDNAYVQPIEISTSADAELAPGGAYVFEISVPEGVTGLDITVDGNVTSSVHDTAPGVVSGLGGQPHWTVATDGGNVYYLSVANPGIDSQPLHVEVRAK